ncbi:MAG: beta-N-acetylhexosaminidase [Lachnospiraceae bacterium]|nr:beta-N-acetylhexosaminidase [Lachnospiraceae bacterium]
MEIEVLSNEEKRECRRQRRVRNQRRAYISLVISVLVLVAVVLGGLFFVNRQLNLEQQISEQPMEEIEVIEEEIIEEVSTLPEEEETIEEAEEVYSDEKLLDEVVEAVISEMTLEEKVAGLFVVTPEGITGVSTAVQAGDGTKAVLEKYPVGGFIYFKKNIESEDQIKKMIENTISYNKYPMFIAVDEEGGKVTRLADVLGLNNVGPMADIGATGDSTKAYDAMKNVGTYLKDYGFNVDFAPVADVLTNAENASIGNRSFGNDANLVAGMVTMAMNGLKDADVTACIKHFPGLGDASADTHNGLAVIDKSLDELKEIELIPFISAIENGADMIMVGHMSLPQIIGDNTPATMSKEVISDLLRSELGFNGVVITDAMNMGAITEYYSADEAAIRALKAGADMVLMPEDFTLAYEGVIAAVKDGTISEERINNSLKRVFRIKYADSVGE